MKTKLNLLSALTALAVSGAASLGQGTASTNLPATTSTGAVLRVSFAATCQAFDSSRGRIVTTRITERNIIAQAVGGSPTDRNLTSHFALAYNVAEDSLQVVDTNQQPVVDVMHFGGGAAIADSRQLVRFTFLFFPGQTNEFGAETNLFGSAVITERTNRVGRANTTATPSLLGRLQFMLSGGNVLGTTNPFVMSSVTNGLGTTNAIPGTNGAAGVGSTKGSAGTGTALLVGGFLMANSNLVFDTSAQICQGVFTTARTVPAVTPPLAPPGSSTNAPAGTNTPTGGTNGVVAGTATNGIALGVTTNTGAGTVVGASAVTGTTIATGVGTLGMGTNGAIGTASATGLPITSTPGF